MGGRIAFASARSGKRNIWLLSIDGGEAQQPTDVKTGVGQFRWTPTAEPRCRCTMTSSSVCATIWRSTVK